MKTSFVCMMVGAFVAGTLPVAALINPTFTPAVLVKESDWIASGTVVNGKGSNLFTAAVATTLKGDKAVKTVIIDASKAINAEVAKAFGDTATGSSERTALFFSGKFSEGGAGGEQPDPDAAQGKAFIHVGGKWFDLEDQGAGKPYALVQMDAHMEATWAGSSDMLLRAVKYALSDDTADFPVRSGVEWLPAVKAATVKGGMDRIRPVDLAGNGKWVLHVQSVNGDHLFRYDATTQTLKDITVSLKLASKSQVAAWGDFNGDGLLDLASYDGKALSVWSQQKDGTFASQKIDLPATVICKDLQVVDAGDKGGAALLIAGGAAPVMIRNLQPKIVALSEGGVSSAALGKPAGCHVADFDGDGIADVMALFEKGSLLYKGKGGGEFQPAVACTVALGQGVTTSCVGDFDQDGLLDVVCIGEDAVRLWQNQGGGKFEDLRYLSGEFNYIPKPGAVDCGVCDVNNDGIQDIFIAYAGQAPELYFGRGFRSFGHAHELDVAEHALLPDAMNGQKTGCMADVNGDGAQDMILGLANGDIWIFLRSTEQGDPLTAEVALSLKSSFKGPALVNGWIGARPLGAWNVVPGVNDALFGLRDAGTVTAKWRLPGDPEKKKDVLVVNKPVRFEIP